MQKVKENPENLKSRQLKFCERMKEKGYIRIAQWVPKRFKEKVKEFVKSLRD